MINYYPNITPQDINIRGRFQNQDEIPPEDVTNKERTATRDPKMQIDKPFDLGVEIGKLKVAIPLSELAKHDMYKQQIKKSLQLTNSKDDVNVLDDTPELLFGPEVDGKTIVTGVLPFYVSLHIHDKILHNAMFDSGASHNLMPKAVMERLNLDITRPYKDLFSFDSSQVKCLGLIKDLCVSLVQFPNKTILMDVVVADIPPKYGMLLSRSWGAKLQGSLQLDMSYATISVFGQPKRLYRETLMKYMVSSEEKPQNFPIYAVHSDIDSYILFNDSIGLSDNLIRTETLTQEQNIGLTSSTCQTSISPTKHFGSPLGVKDGQANDEAILENKWEKKPQLMLTLPSHEQNLKSPHQQGILWVLEFDGSVNKLGAGAGVWIHNKEKGYATGKAYRLNFRCTNNMAEYEALLLGLKVAKSLQAPSLSIMGDSDLVIQQVKGNFVTNDKRLRSYRSAVIEILETFPEFAITKIPRGHNLHAHSLATFASTFKFPLEPNNCFTAEVRYRPSIPNNVREWQVFEDDMQINNFLTLQQEFTGLNIDLETASQSQIFNKACPSQIQFQQSAHPMSPRTAKQLLSPTIFNSENIQQIKQIDCEEMSNIETEIIQLKDNFLPVGLTPLEDIFDSNDIPRKPKMQPLDARVEECNIGTIEKPKIVKLSTSLPPDQKPKYIDLFK